MKNNILHIISIIFALSGTSAYADPWTLSIDAGMTVTQNAYSDNWQGGENGSVNWMFLSNSLAEKQISPLVNNKNVLKLQFGQNYLQDSETKDWSGPEKSNDLIDFESIFRFSYDFWVEPFVSVRLESKFVDKSDPENSVYFNPITLTESAGAIKVLIKEDAREWTARIGAGLREHISRENLDPVNGARSTETATDGGFEFVNDLRTPLAGGRINLQSKLIVFQALFNSKSDELEGLPNENYWKSPDVNFENIFTVSVTRYLMVNLYTQILYDKEVNKAGRFKQTLGLGFTWKYEKISPQKP